jgi:hypothetical protein
LLIGVLLENLLYLVAVPFLVVVVEAVDVAFSVAKTVDSCLVMVLGLSFLIWWMLILSSLFLFCVMS